MTEKTARRPRVSRGWALPTAAAVALAGGIGYAGIADASSGLEPKSAQDILTGMQQATMPPLAGTVVATADLGLPELPGVGDSAELTSLVSGSHTMRVWYGGPDKMRLAKLGDASETNVIRNGEDAWIWSSTEKEAVHYNLADAEHATDLSSAHPKPTAMPETPQQASQLVLDSAEKYSTVSTNSIARVAGRDVYELVLTPKSTNTLVKNVRLAVDGQTMIPLRVQVYSRKLSAPAYEIGYSSLSMGPVEDRMFTFTAPSGTSVQEADTHELTGEHSEHSGGAGHTKADASPVQVSGQGWESVYVMKAPADLLEADAAPASDRGPHGAADLDPAAIIASLPTTSGAWGSGRVLEGTLFSMILTDDGRVAMGAVDSGALAAALTKTPGQ
ncbi:LolA family protein [Gephyromycinifex aptenodytis]|uniref:LolA family protein n=1 Tax=Gephyromycinifex aptenodytis TaxID=2716227 RepID=UPI00144683F9|nr:hypothetical protein [Gephyromycinifex aptenodytis]